MHTTGLHRRHLPLQHQLQCPQWPASRSGRLRLAHQCLTTSVTVTRTNGGLAAWVQPPVFMSVWVALLRLRQVQRQLQLEGLRSRLWIAPSARRSALMRAVTITVETNAGARLAISNAHAPTVRNTAFQVASVTRAAPTAQTYQRLHRSRCRSPHRHSHAHSHLHRSLSPSRRHAWTRR